MFKDVLQAVVEQTEGGMAALLMGFDGISVDQYKRPDVDFNVENVGMEYSVILTQVARAAELLDAGHAREVSVQAENMITLMRLLNDEYFVAVALRPNGNLGKARFLLRTQVDKLLRGLT